MPWKLIMRYSLHALAFGLVLGAVWLIIRLIAGRRPLTRRDGLWLAAVVYLGMVLEIIGLRLGLQPIAPLTTVPRLQLMYTTVEQWRKGPGLFIYHGVGNMIWFAPVGFFLPRLFPGARPRHALLAGLALSLLVETLQFVLGTGLPDIDDVWLNTLGAYLSGIVCFFRIKQRKRSFNPNKV